MSAITGHLVGGISSAGRSLPPLDGRELHVGRSAGPYVWDAAGRRYVDTALGFGATVLGHAPPAVVAAVERALRDGPMPAFAHAAEEAAAEALARHAGPLDRVVFTNSGSEAVHLACRVARAATGRGRIAKIAAGYDGWYDDVAFGNAGSAEALLAGDRRPARGSTVLLRYNDRDDTDALFSEYDDIAAVLVEPVLANAGCIMPRPGYLEHLQAAARRHGALVILDEVLTGFRVRAGLFGHALGLDPDLATVGKAIGSGIPVAALLGRADVMRVVAEGRAVRAGTYSGNPMACAAVLATLEQLDGSDYAALLARGDALRSAVEAAFRAAGVPLSSTGLGSVFTLWFSGDAPTGYAAAARVARPDLSLALHARLRRRGVLVMPLPFGRVYLSFAHDRAAMLEVEEAFRSAAAGLLSDRSTG